jgi:hypothetical protein
MIPELSKVFHLCDAYPTYTTFLPIHLVQRSFWTIFRNILRRLFTQKGDTVLRSRNELKLFT